MTFFTTILSGDPVLTGDESYPVDGCFVPNKTVQQIQKEFAGLKVHWNCLEKAQIAQRILKHGTVVVGSLLVWNGNFSCNYGYQYNPPFEFHAWIRLGSGIIFDPGLPGVILKGMITYDHIGPAINGRQPVILNGIPSKWMEYHERSKYNELFDEKLA